MRNLSPALCALVALALPSSSHALGFAQAGETEEIEERARGAIAEGGDATAEESWSLSAELGTALSRGNTETFHLSSSARLLVKLGENWLSTTRARALYEESYGVNTANNWGLTERVDRFLGPRFTTFAAAGIERDVFAGLDYRYSGQLGGSFLLLESADQVQRDLIRDRLQLELGFYGARELYTLPPNAAADAVQEEESRNIYAGRVALAYLHTFRKGTNAGIEVEAIEDFNDTENFILNDTAFISAAIVDGLAMKFTLTHRFDNQPPSEDLEEHDLLLTAGIVVSL